MTSLTTEEAKILLQVGYFILLLYSLRRIFNGIETKLDILIKVLTSDKESSKKQPTPPNPPKSGRSKR